MSESHPNALPRLAIRAVGKSFAGNKALADINIELHRGEILGLLGMNGAGKSTLIKILAGIYFEDGGTIEIDGVAVDKSTRAAKIAFLHQDLAVVGTMTVAENIAYQAGFVNRGGLISWKRTANKATECLNILEVDVDPNALVSELNAAERALVAIARALAQESDILVLDEPTATLSSTESRRLLVALRRLRDQGVSMLYVSHYLQEVRDITDRMVVLRDGQVVLDCPTDGVDQDELVEAITGRKLDTTRPADKERPQRKVGLVQVRDMVADRAGPVSFDLVSNEICVLTGLVGAGHHQVGRALIGDGRVYGGSVTWSRNARDQRPASYAFTSGNRGDEAICPGLTVRENMSVAPRWFARQRTERRHATALVQRYNVKASGTESIIDSLSGGNQQKVVLARAIESTPDLLVLEDPTNGIDIGARLDIYDLLRAEAEQGRGVLVITTDFEEAALLADRVLVFRGGLMVEELRGNEINEHTVIRTATGDSHDIRG